MHRSEILSSIGCETCSMWTRCGQDICVDPVQFRGVFFSIPKIFLGGFGKGDFCGDFFDCWRPIYSYTGQILSRPQPGQC